MDKIERESEEDTHQELFGLREPNTESSFISANIPKLNQGQIVVEKISVRIIRTAKKRKQRKRKQKRKE